MSVTTKFNGRLGNNLFQYTLARLYAEQHGLKLITKWNNGQYFRTTEPMTGESISGPIFNITDNNYEEFSGTRHQAHFSGYFQRSKWYKPHRDKIKSYFDLPMVQPNDSDLVLHIRAGDYHNMGVVIHPNWYKNILRQETYNRLFIVMSPLEADILDQFKEFNPIIVSSSVYNDFLFIRNFKKIICSNSSFCWWAAFLGDPSKVYTFPSWVKSGLAELADLPNAVQVDGPFLTDSDAHLF